jgi:hypothetical protein
VRSIQRARSPLFRREVDTPQSSVPIFEGVLRLVPRARVGLCFFHPGIFRFPPMHFLHRGHRNWNAMFGDDFIYTGLYTTTRDKPYLIRIPKQKDTLLKDAKNID